MYFKILRAGRSCNGGVYTWSLPHDGIPGEWSVYIKGHLKACHSGYHIAENSQMFEWIGSVSEVELYVAEPKFYVLKSDKKSVVHQVRLIARITLSRENYLKILDEAFQYYKDNLMKEYPSSMVEKTYEFLKRSRRFGNLVLLGAFCRYITSRVYNLYLERKFREFFYASFYRHAGLSKYEPTEKES